MRMAPAELNPLHAKALLRRFGVRPRKSLGQNFLVSGNDLRRIIEVADLTGRDTVLEIGAGLGALTERLVQHAARVVAVELDSRLLPILQTALEGVLGIDLVVGDILELPWDALDLKAPYIIVANIPYSITSALLRRVLEAPQPAERMVLTVQREVAERVNAKPGHMSLLALSVQIYGTPRIAGRIPARSFYPQPEVDSAILRIDMHGEPKVSSEMIEPIFRLARAGFGQRRKQLRNSIAAGLGVSTEVVETWLRRSGIEAKARAQELDIAAWGRLAAVATGA